ncbi:MAG: hypothetical protein P8169_07545, partial [Chloroflexota bacterium]
MKNDIRHDRCPVNRDHVQQTDAPKHDNREKEQLLEEPREREPLLYGVTPLDNTRSLLFGGGASFRRKGRIFSHKIELFRDIGRGHQISISLYKIDIQGPAEMAQSRRGIVRVSSDTSQ